MVPCEAAGVNLRASLGASLATRPVTRWRARVPVGGATGYHAGVDDLDGLLSLCTLAGRVQARGARLQHEVGEGYAHALGQLGSLREGPLVEPRIPAGMLEALCVAGELGRPTEALDRHYTRSMPAMLAGQLRGTASRSARLFPSRLKLGRMPRLREALEGLFALVASTGLDCGRALGAATPSALLAAQPTLGDLYASVHFGRSMPMLYAAPGDLADLPAGVAPEAWIDARYAGPIAHELAHLHPLDEALVPAPGNLHEALAAWLGSEAFPEQLFPRAPAGPADPGGLDARPGGPWFAAVGGWVARALGPADAIRAQAGALDLHDALPPGCAAALRLYGWLAHLETSAPHLLADTFEPQRWWKLIDLHRDPALAAEFHDRHVAPLLAAPPPPAGAKLQQQWHAALDAIPWSALPAWRDPPSAEDEKLALRACRALGVRTVRQGMSFRAQRAEPPAFVEREIEYKHEHARGKGAAAEVIAAQRAPLGEGPLSLDVAACQLRAGWPGPDAVGAPPYHPYPPALCAAWARAGVSEVRAAPAATPRCPTGLERAQR